MRQIVEDVPIEMEACLDCGAVQCLDDKYETCQHRLAREAALKAAASLPTKSRVNDGPVAGPGIRPR